MNREEQTEHNNLPIDDSEASVPSLLDAEKHSFDSKEPEDSPLSYDREETATEGPAEELCEDDTDVDVSQDALKKDQCKTLISGAFDYLELFAWSVLAVLILFTFAIRLCRVDGESMENTLYDKQNLVLYSLAYEPKQGDIVVFHLSEHRTMQKTLVKRVIAVGGQEVVIDTNAKTITVDGVPFEDANAVLKDRYSDQITNQYDEALFYKHYDRKTGIFKATVPENTVFVLGDNRNNSKDSRNSEIGFVDERCILGKVIVRLSPFTVFS